MRSKPLINAATKRITVQLLPWNLEVTIAMFAFSVQQGRLDFTLRLQPAFNLCGRRGYPIYDKEIVLNRNDRNFYSKHRGMVAR